MLPTAAAINDAETTSDALACAPTTTVTFGWPVAGSINHDLAGACAAAPR